MIGLIAILGLALVGQVSTSHQGLVRHPIPTEELSHRQVMSRLRQVSIENDDNEINLVADVLYRAKDKQSLMVIDGLSVARLVAQNHISISDCTEEGLRGRNAVVEMVPVRRFEDGVDYALRTYLLATLFSAARFCVDHRDEVVSSDLNSAEYLRRLEWGLASCGFHGDKARDERRAEHYLAETVYNGNESILGQMIKTGLGLSA